MNIKDNWFSNLSKILRLSIILVMVIFVTASGNKLEVRSENVNINKSLDLKSMALKVKEDIANDLYEPIDTFVGDLTGYGADCPLCGGTLACMPSLDVLHGNVSYTDDDYGKVRIVASSKNLPCGSIVKFDSPRISDEPVVAIVLDRGVRGNALDLLSVNEEYASKYVGRSTITYDVLRSGWKR